MPNRSSNPKRPIDVNQLAKSIVDQAIGEAPPQESKKVESGRIGGLKGGKARAAKLTPEERSRIARNAAEKRWSRGD